MLKKILLKIIRVYQFFSHSILNGNCRYYPSCSEYSYKSIEKYGILKGVWLSLKRIAKCHPFANGGIDNP